MSRAYRISVSQSIRKHMRVEDGFRAPLEILAVLPAGDMAGLLARELAALGFERDGHIMRRTDDDGVAVDVDLDAGTVTARLAAEADVDHTVERSRQVEEEHAERETRRLEDAARADLERHVDARRAELSREVTETLEGKLRDLRAELDRATNRATAEALKIRARQLGEVKEISENPDTGELTIKVEV